MTETSANSIRQFVSAATLQEMDQWVVKYPEHERQSAVMQVLMMVQEELGHLDEASMDAVADYLSMPPIAVYEVASFYSMYEHRPIGRHLVSICTNISCKLRDSNAVVDHLEKKLGVKLGDTTEDGRFTLRSVECLGACVNAPMMQVNKDYHENLNPEKIDAILEQYS
jgi:NADH-quinone oxidoreductase subunit E